MKFKSRFTSERLSNILFFIQDGMMMELNHPYNKNGDHGRGDALWRTGLAYIAYKCKELKEAILSCYVTVSDNKGQYIQAHRYPDQSTHNVSRDQITSSLAALFINGDIDDVRRIVKGLRWKLSKNTEVVEEYLDGKSELMKKLMRPIVSFFTDARITLDMRFWLISISSKWWLIRQLAGGTFSFISIFIMLFSGLWNIILYGIMGLDVVTYEEAHACEERTDGTEKQKKAWKLHHPMYAFHLFAIQLYTTPPGIFKWVCEIVSLMFVEKSNYLLKLIFGGEVTREEIDNYRPAKGIRWQSRYYRGINDGCTILEENKVFSKITNTQNVLDNDILHEMADRHPELIKEYN